MSSLGQVLRGLRSAPPALPAAIQSLLQPPIVQTLRGRTKAQPFITVRLPDGRFLLCQTQLDRETFAEEAERASRALGGSPLLDGFRYALQNRLYQAAFALFDWIYRPRSDAGARVFAFVGEERPFHGYWGFPIIDMTGGAARDSTERGRDLAKLFDALEATTGNDQTRFWFLKALAFALAKHFGSLGEFATALDYVERGMRVGDRFAHLETCRHALNVKQRGAPVPPRLQKFAGADGHPLDLSPALQSLLERTGDQRFITVQVADGGDGGFLVCSEQRDREAFSQDLEAASRAMGGSRLLDGIRYVLHNEVYQAAFSFFDWIHLPGPDAKAIVHSFEPEERSFLAFFYRGDPIIDMSGKAERDADARGQDLARLFDALEASFGNDQTRVWFMQALAFALSRHFGVLGRFAAGLDYVDRAMRLADDFMHLETCRHVLELKQRGLPVPPRLEKFAGWDLHAFDDRTCTHPFTRFDINPSGEVHICCAMWAPVSLGNVVHQDVEAVLNSANAQKIRQSMTDGSFRYCNHLGCSVMVKDALPRKDDAAIVTDPVMRPALLDGKTRVEEVRELTFALDYTCNLSCPSCRTEQMIQKESAFSSERNAVSDKLRPLLPRLQTLYLNPAGEFLASRPSRRLLASIDPNECPDLHIDIISNGTLFSEAEWQKFSNVHGLVRNLRVSIDAATGPTFEAIRRGGKWAPFLENIRYIGRLRKAGQVKEFCLAFTYQVGNFREMKDFVRLSEQVGADVASFQAIQHTEAMTDTEYAERAVHRLDHPLYGEFLEVIGDPVFEQPNVHTDFGDYVRDVTEQWTGVVTAQLQ